MNIFLLNYNIKFNSKIDCMGRFRILHNIWSPYIRQNRTLIKFKCVAEEHFVNELLQQMQFKNDLILAKSEFITTMDHHTSKRIVLLSNSMKFKYTTDNYFVNELQQQIQFKN